MLIWCQSRSKLLVHSGIDVLFLCTGNICRSPMAEAMLRHRLDSLGVEARVHSAGIVFEGRPADPPGVHVMAGRGIDMSTHRSRFMTAEMIGAADVVLGMAREHVREAVALEPQAFPWTFTLKELVRRASSVGRRGAEESMRDWLLRAHAGRTYRDLLGWSDEDDVPDPMGYGVAVFERIAADLDLLLDRIVELAFFPALNATEGPRDR